MTLKRALLISRPIMWPWTALIYLVGIENFSNFSSISAIELILFTFPLNFFIYGLNDIYDAKSDRINERKHEAQGIVLEDEEVPQLKKVIWIAPFLLFGISIVTINIEHIILSLLFIIFAFAYSHPSIRTKEIPILDCITSAAIYYIPGLIAYSLHSSILALPVIIVLFALPHIGVHALTTLVDVDADKKTNMKTIGVVFGKKKTILFMLAIFTLALFSFWGNAVLVSMCVVSLTIGVMLFTSVDKKDEGQFLFTAPVLLMFLIMVIMVYYILQNNTNWS